MDPLKNFYHPRMDASENTFLRRQLELVRSKSYDQLFPDTKFRKLVPIDNSVPAGAEYTTFDTYSKVGSAQITADYANDGPAVGLFATDAQNKIFGMTNHYSYNLQEVRAGMMNGRGLPERKAMVAREAIEQKHDEIMLLGDSAWGLNGLFTLSGTTTYTISTEGGNTDWADKTPDGILVDMFGIVNQIIEDTEEVHTPNTLVLPLSELNRVRQLSMGDGRSGTVLQYFLANVGIEGFQVESSTRLESNAAWTGKRMVCYKKDPNMLQGVIPVEFEQLPPEPQGLRTVVVNHARTGGIELYYPKSVAYGDDF